ncbi:HNH endonuclease signature motif containing protein [Kribbella albertanoniae]|uniref:HNH endonuclease n=1 Tax=Kribbella albertanoniae TaxID=1266829 RepID=A0A4R4PNN8_9ACTN|nr:HNH endonuclease signature motif containing protein [Kribbella albertanoniae]TDC23724.1 HNH endonuclease [Kribbella albertanoniae]
MEILAMPPVYTQSSSELLTRLDTIQAAKALLKADELQTMGRLEEMGAAQEMGARDMVELVSERYRLDRREVRKDLAFTVALRKYPLVAAAMADPTDPERAAVVRPDLAKIIVGTLEKAPSTVPVETLTVAEEQMVKMAGISNPRELAKFGQDVLARLDTDGPEPAEDEAAAKEYLRLRQTAGGVKFTGFLAGASGEQLKTQIHQGSKPHKTIDGERDPRTQDQRQADAFKATMDAAAGNPDHPGVPHLTVTIDFNDLKAALAAFGGGTGNSAGGAVGELVFGDNLSAGAVRLLACDAAVLPIVLGGDSQPLDVGREQRFVNRYIRRALNKRDKGCVVCQAPPWMCHAHHLTHWAEGGPTSLQNLALLCSAHHRAVHNGQWAISITAAGVQVTRPSWADPPPVTDRAAIAALIDWVTPAPDSSACASGATASGATASGASASTTGVSSNPTHAQPRRLPAASILPDPARAADREAFRAQLLAHAPSNFDPWGTNATSTTGPP